MVGFFLFLFSLGVQSGEVSGKHLGCIRQEGCELPGFLQDSPFTDVFGVDCSKHDATGRPHRSVHDEMRNIETKNIFSFRMVYQEYLFKIRCVTIESEGERNG